jgi:ubiquinone/menaquinone biosynthesis C-methylase UbiE
MQTMYESDTYSENNPTWHEEDSPWKAGHIGKIIKDNNIPHRRVCDVGCGVGAILANLEAHLPDADFTGYEISPYAYERARQRQSEHVKFVLGDVTKAEKTDFDVVLLIDVIEHVEDYFKFLKDLKNIGTYKVLHIPLDLSVQSVFRVSPIMGQRAGVGHIHYFLKDTALATPSLIIVTPPAVLNCPIKRSQAS